MPDLPSSPRKTVSSTSAAARNPSSQPQKKPGAPKPKGAVRAKSGCYTCRIRRKKCDEQPNAEGACQTCVRLRLQCLGFGAKRPDWMRENNSVTELREKIKTFLASQGMIKGHSGSGPRSTEGEPPVLVLVENLQQLGPPGTPPTPTMSSSSQDGYRQQQGSVSHVRENGASNYHHGPPGAPTLPPEQHQYPQQQQQQTTWSSHLPDMNSSHPHALPHPHHDPALGRMLPGPENLLFTTAPPPPQQNNLMQSGSLVSPIAPSSSSSWPHNGMSSALYKYPSSSHYDMQPPTPSTTTASPSTAVAPYQPAIVSRFSPLYTQHFSDGSDDDMYSPESGVNPLPYQVTSYDASIPRDQQNLVVHYMHKVLPIQYLLSDTNINKIIYDIIRQSNEARDAACMLAAIHRDRMGYPSDDGAVVPAAQLLYQRLFKSLLSKQQYTEGDAMAGLHAVSTILFAGGRGAWNLFLDVASAYVRTVLSDTRYTGPEDILRRCGDSTRFIIKTTMWFDVLASVTTQTVPRFLEVYRQLFDRTHMAHIDDPSAPPVVGVAEPPETSMLPIMGCENAIVLAIAEISNLAHWKESQRRRNCLSVPRLVELGELIERKFLVPAAQSPIQSTPAGAYVHAPAGATGAGPAGGLGLDPGMGMGMNVGVGMGMGMGMNGGVHHPHAHAHAHMGMNGVNGHAHAHAHTHSVGIGVAMNSASSALPGGGRPTSPAESEVLLRRHLTNDIFRASARVYLHTVLSGDYPSTPEIMQSVTETIECLYRIPLDKPLVSRSVLRSVVFGICIAGCLTDSREQRQFLMNLLETQQGESVGNVAEVMQLMQKVWSRRDSHRGAPVNWREVMAEGEMLLLV